MGSVANGMHHFQAPKAEQTNKQTNKNGEERKGKNSPQWPALKNNGHLRQVSFSGHPVQHSV